MNENREAIVDAKLAVAASIVVFPLLVTSDSATEPVNRTADVHDTTFRLNIAGFQSGQFCLRL